MFDWRVAIPFFMGFIIINWMNLTITKSSVMWSRPKLSVTEQNPPVTVDDVYCVYPKVSGDSA